MSNSDTTGEVLHTTIYMVDDTGITCTTHRTFEGAVAAAHLVAQIEYGAVVGTGPDHCTITDDGEAWSIEDNDEEWIVQVIPVPLMD